MSVDSKMSADAAEAVRLTATRNRARIGTLLSLTLVALLALMWILLSFSTKNFATPNNIQNLLRQGSMTAILAIGQTFVIITAGIDLSVGAVVGFTSVIVAWLLAQGLPILVAIPSFIFLHHSRWGRYLFSIGSNPEAARLSGVNVSRVIYLAYTLSALFAAFVG